MRLLECRDDGDFRLTACQDDNTPPYAILSHTWVEGQEVTFEDLMAGTGKDKHGNKKIRFCGEQARRDGLQYFWVDTCCIDKANYAELSYSINSMFRWYRNATRCYVYLSDLSISTFNSNDEHNPQPWESDFRRCAWFSRGWTLQELLAASSVEFFSCEPRRVGDKSSLEHQIHEITGIPKSALRGARLSQFSDKKRFSWIQHRKTTVEEDKAYALLGIFDVHIPPRYGEGMANAFKRLEEEIDKLNKCLQDLRLTDPRDDKKRIEHTKGGLLADSYRWILENTYFQQWRDDKQSRLLWIKGDPGKGKTMLLCGIVDELNKSTAGAPLLSYFFCQATDSRINKGTAVLRGLIYMLLSQQPSLISHVWTKYEKAGKVLFEDANAWVVLSEILTNILHDSTLQTTYLIIDALDECEENRRELLAFVAQNSSVSSRVKWIVSSRNWPDIEEQINTANQKTKVSLELNEKSISTAVDSYIEWKVEQLVKQKMYDNDTRDAIQRHLLLNANNTFLWVALVCQQLADPKVRRHHTLAKLDAFPPGLNDLYGRMMGQIRDSADADLCKRILAVVLVVYRPLTLDELESFVDIPTGASLREIIELCGSFLTLQSRIVSFVHQSATEYLLKEAASDIFPPKSEHIQDCIFSRSIQAMEKTLQQNIFRLDRPAILVNEINPPDPDPLAAVRYSCVYWVKHLCLIPDQVLDYEDKLSDNGAIFTFFKRHFLHWLEVLGLIKRLSESISIINNLLSIVDAKESPNLYAFVSDAKRFALSNRLAVEQAPLQVYCSGLIFAPQKSIVRRQFEGCIPAWIQTQPKVQADWSSVLQTLEGHSDLVTSVVFSPDGKQVVSGSRDKTVRLWDAATGVALQTLEGHLGWVTSVAFSPDSRQVVTGSLDRTVRLWDAATGLALQRLEGHSGWVTSYSGWVTSVAFSPDGRQIVSGSEDRTVRLWDAATGTALPTLEGHLGRVTSVAFSPDGRRVVSGSVDRTVRLWDITGVVLQTLEVHSDLVTSVALSPNNRQVVSGSDDGTVWLLDVVTGAALLKLDAHSSRVTSVAFLPDGRQVMSGSDDGTVRLWDAATGAALQTFEVHADFVTSVALSPNNRQVVSGSDDGMVRLWDAATGAALPTPDAHSGLVTSVAVSPNGKQVVSGSRDKTVRLWNAATGIALQTLKGHSGWITLVAFSPDSRQIVSGSEDGTVRLWDAATGTALPTLEGHLGRVTSVAFSPDGRRVVSGSLDKTVRLWDATTGAALQTLEGHSDLVTSVAFSPDRRQVVSGSVDRTVRLWDATTERALQTLKGHSDLVTSVAFSPDRRQVVSGSVDRTVRLWDATTGRALQTLEGHSGSVNSVAFSPDGSQVVSGSGDNKVRLWEAATGAALQTLGGQLGWVNSVTFSPDRQVMDILLVSEGWIAEGGTNILWLPIDYRSPSCIAVWDRTLALGYASGRVSILSFKEGLKLI